MSDDYDNFDIEKEGDAGPIQRSVGFGPVDTINWMLPLSRLILGREGAETSVRSSSLDEPITPTSFTLKDCSTKDSARAAAIKCDTRGLFVGKSGKKLYELLFEAQNNDYQAHDLIRLNPDVSGSEGFARICIQHNPDTTVHCVRADGQAAVLLYDKEDEVEAWWRVVTDGAIEDAFVLPGTRGQCLLRRQAHHQWLDQTLSGEIRVAQRMLWLARRQAGRQLHYRYRRRH